MRPLFSSRSHNCGQTGVEGYTGMARELTVALVGATGVVGRELLRIMESRELPVRELRLLATKRSAGATMLFHDEPLVVQETTPAAFDGVDVAFISAGTAASRELAPLARDRGALVFDDSAVFRMDPDVPLVVPEINGADLRAHQGIIATPNCSTLPVVLTVAPLLRERRVLRIIADTYQSVSGSGGAAVDVLRRQAAGVLADEPVSVEVYPKQIAFNAIPQVDIFQEDGYTREEWKMAVESRKILHQPDLAFSATCVRIPSIVSHAVAVHVEFDAPLDPAHARAMWSAQHGVVVQDNPAASDYPTPLEAAGHDAVYVGRARRDTSHPNGLVWWCVTDNLRKGAALNILQMVEWMQADGCL